MTDEEEITEALGELFREKKVDMEIEPGEDPKFSLTEKGNEDVIAAGDGQQQKPHEILNVAPDADPDVVRAAARRLAANVHPDKPDGDAAEFKRIQQAKGAMLDE